MLNKPSKNITTNVVTTANIVLPNASSSVHSEAQVVLTAKVHSMASRRTGIEKRAVVHSPQVLQQSETSASVQPPLFEPSLPFVDEDYFKDGVEV